MTRRASRGHPYYRPGRVPFTPQSALAAAIIERAILDVESAEPHIADEAWSFLTANSGGWKQSREDVAGLFMDPDVLRDNVLRRWPKKPGPRSTIPAHYAPAWEQVLLVLKAHAPNALTYREIAAAAGISRDRASGGLDILKQKGLVINIGTLAKGEWALTVPQTTSAVPSTTDHLAA